MRIARPLVALAMLALTTPLLAADPKEIVGTWRGTSICVKFEENRACHDEQVQYDFAVSPSHKDMVALNAKKLVDGSYQTMGEMEFRYDEATHRWASKFRTRNGREGLWSYEVKGNTMTGTCVMLPDTLVRNVNVKR